MSKTIYRCLECGRIFDSWKWKYDSSPRGDDESIKEYVRASFTPYHNQYRAKVYIRDEFVNAEVTRFYVCPTAMIIWVKLKEADNE